MVDAVVADDDTEILRCDVLELVRLVNDGHLALRNHLAERVAAHLRVGAEQVVIDDHHVRLGGALAHARHEAVFVARTLAAETVLGGRGDGRPDRQIVW